MRAAPRRTHLCRARTLRVYGSAAVVNADAMVAYTTDGKGGTNHLAFTHVFAKKGGKWQLVSHQSLRLEK